MPLEWRHILDAHDSQLDELAARYHLHPLHVEDCRHGNQNAKIEFHDDYVFVVLKPVWMDDEGVIHPSDFDLFIGPGWVITVEEETCAPLHEVLKSLRDNQNKLTSDQLFYRIFDNVVDLYHPVTDRLSERIDQLEEQALEKPQAATIEQLFTLRRALIGMRRILANSRDLLSHLLRTEHHALPKEMMPFWRDVYDHVTRSLDTIEILRDLVSGATELYLSSVANQTNQVMKVLTVFGTVATPAIIITGIYGMNVEHLPFSESPHSWAIIIALIAVVSGATLLLFRRMRWL